MTSSRGKQKKETLNSQNFYTYLWFWFYFPREVNEKVGATRVPVGNEIIDIEQGQYESFLNI